MMDYVWISVVSLAASALGLAYLRNDFQWSLQDRSKLYLWLGFLLLNLAIGCGFVWMLGAYGYSIGKIIKLTLLCICLFVAAIIDQKHLIIPNRLLLAAVAIRLIFLAVEIVGAPELTFDVMIDAVIGVAIGAGCFLFVALISKNSVGMGDVKLFGVIGLFVGMNILSVLILSLFLSAITAVILLLLRKKSRKDALPMAPYAFAGTVLSVLAGY